MAVNQRREDGFTALMSASQQGHEGVVGLLLSEGARVEQKMVNGATALMAAAWKGQTKCVSLLCADDVYAGSIDMQLDGYNDDFGMGAGTSALMVAAKHGQCECVRVLLGAGADVRQCDAQGQSAETMARAGGYAAVVQLLVARSEVLQLQVQ